MPHIEVQLARGKLGENLSPKTVLVVPDAVMTILSEVSTKYQISVPALLGDWMLSAPRHEAIRRIRAEVRPNHRRPPYKQIAGWVGRHETTVRAALGKWVKPREDGTVVRFRRKKKTHCIHGHALVGDNLYAYGGKKHCRTCRRAQKLDRRRWA